MPIQRANLLSTKEDYQRNKFNFVQVPKDDSIIIQKSRINQKVVAAQHVNVHTWKCEYYNLEKH